jgi:hypothetical protein
VCSSFACSDAASVGTRLDRWPARPRFN